MIRAVFKQFRFSLPMIITVSRLFLLFPLLATLGGTSFYHWSGLAVFTDIADGGIARLLGQETTARKIIDTLIDKIVFSVVLIACYSGGYIPAFVFFWVVLYFSFLLIGGAFALRLNQVITVSDNLGRLAIVALLLLVAYYYAGLEIITPVVIISITATLNIAALTNYAGKYLYKFKRTPLL